MCNSPVVSKEIAALHLLTGWTGSGKHVHPGRLIPLWELGHSEEEEKRD